MPRRMPQWYAAWQHLTELLEQMLRLPKPIVAAVDGAAVGAGLGLALAADMIVASTRASFSAVAVRRGLVEAQPRHSCPFVSEVPSRLACC